MALLFALHHRNKENEPSSLNGTAPPRRRRSTLMNPYSQPLQFNQNERNARRSITVKATSLSTNTSQIIKDSPAIKRILKATECSSVEELLARDQQKSQAKATNASTGASKVATSTNRSKTKTAPNEPKAAPDEVTKPVNTATNVAKVSKSTNGNKATSGSKAMTNPKKKAKSKQFY